MSKTAKMSIKAASRIYSATAKNGTGKVPADTFAARAMGAAMRPTVAGSAPPVTNGKGGRRS